jgi:hypothetical protein
MYYTHTHTHTHTHTSYAVRDDGGGRAPNLGLARALGVSDSSSPPVHEHQDQYRILRETSG